MKMNETRENENENVDESGNLSKDEIKEGISNSVAFHALLSR